jgi:putative hydrolase of the HAD superfamily
MRDDAQALIVDYGGVLTTDVFTSFQTFCAHEGLPPDAVKHLFRTDPAAHELLVGLEEGTLSDLEFEQRFARLMGVTPDGLIDRMLGHAGPDFAVIDAVRTARALGVRTGLISNSWGVSRYDRALLGELFDGVVISGEVGIRKPAKEIYEMGARAVGVAPERCVYVDDLPGNLKPPRELGMHTVHHRDAATTIAEVSQLLNIPLDVQI